MRVLVIGGTAFTGPPLVRELAEAGHETTVFHRGRHEPELPATVRHVHGDVAAFDDGLAELRALRPEVVVDMLAFRAVEARRVLAFAEVARRAVVVSSADVYRAFGRVHRSEPGAPDPTPLTEESPLREKVIDRDYDKVGVERAVAGAALPVTVVRYPAVHGPGDPKHRLYPYLKRMDDGRAAIVLEEALARWRWVRGYAANVAHAVFLAATEERAAGRVYNVADPVPYTESEWVRRIAVAAGWRGDVVSVPAEALPGRARQRYDLRQDYAVDSSRIRRELGYAERVGEDEALRRTVEWERANPPAELRPEDFDYAAEDEALARLRRA